MRVLVIDDESNMRLLLRLILEGAGHEVDEAAHGAAALEQVAKSPPDLVITDMMMPVVNGQELVECLRVDPETATIPIVIVSASASGLENADAVLAKPFDPDALLAAVRSIAARKDAN